MGPTRRTGKRPVGRPRADGWPHITRQEVFDAAIGLIARYGYSGTSLRMIADELKASDGTVKHAVFRAV